MAKNFNQKELLESNNTSTTEGNAGVVGKIFIYASFIFIFPIFWYISRRNRFKKQKERLVELLSNIDVKLTERYNVLSNQFKVAKKALAHEKDLQTAITKARASVTGPQGASNPESVTAKNKMVNGLSARWNMVQENYPEIQAMPVMIELNQTVKGIESDLAAQRRFYTAVARKYNSALVVYPSNVVADSLKIGRFPAFEAEDNKRKNFEMDF